VFLWSIFFSNGRGLRVVVKLFSMTIIIATTSDSYYFGDTGYEATHVEVLVS
jgi:hypothetical protein